VDKDAFQLRFGLCEEDDMAENLSEERDEIVPVTEETPSVAKLPRRRRLAALLRVGLSVTTIVILMLWILGAFRHDVIQEASRPAPEQTSAGFATETVGLSTVSSNTEVVGTVQAEQIASVTSRVFANILEMRASAGQRVTNGETLVVLDDRDLRHRVEQAQEAVRGAEATLAQAESDYKRDKPLFDQQVITPYDFEHTQTNLKTVGANLNRLQQAEKEVEVNMSYAVIRSPFTGVVVDKLADVGDLAAPGKPLLTMYEQNRLWLEASVPEELVSRIHVGESLALRIDALDREVRGPVVQIIPASDPSTRTIVARARINAAKDIVPGMFGRLMIPGAPEEVLTIPAAAVIRAGQLTMVDVVAEGQVFRRTVQLGRSIGNRLEVLSGLAAGEAIVLRAGSPALLPTR
jgi:RND family efflux transporter MFP subunit